ncbi:hypothetical protein RHS01_06137 [Rhizoctonia solani]|uniref:Uncharacterized protein n=1 Tax=Rhizoctonia solani TaxID=456999 RepID=A0A8H7M4J0_9AGAM|nr:hypothetical protein RHS01_06137 [Rhizoctonia solani]
MLAATTNGYDVTAYISHSPGLDGLVSESDLSQLPDNLQLENFSAERTDLLSARTMALAFAITRRASLKVGLWVGGFLLEIISHLWYPAMQKLKRPQPTKRTIGLPNPESLSGYFDTITTVILGEGINGFAGTLASILSIPGVGRAIAVNVVSTAFIIWFIAYIYFEGPHSGTTPKGEGIRRMIWMVMYLPLLASIFLLFVGMKNQFLLTAFISTIKASTAELRGLLNRAHFPNNITNSALWETNPTIKEFMFARKIIWSDEYQKLIEARGNSTNSQEWTENVHAWTSRLSLTIASMGKDGVPENVQTLVDTYYNVNSTFLNQDLRLQNQDPRLSMYSKILIELMDGSLQSARYILIFAAAILISLGLQSLAHSEIKANDPIKGLLLHVALLWGSCFLYFYSSTSERVFQWLEAFWVLPTIAIAYGIQFLIEVTLTRFMDTTKENKRKNSDTEAARPPNLTSQSYYSEPDKDADYSGRQG